MTAQRRIQLALDTLDVESAERAALAAAASIDIVEAGTVLVLNQGLTAVRALRSAFPDRPLVADIRIARAGAKFAAMAFAAGADLVTVVGEAPNDVITGALAAARERGGEVEVELWPGWSPDDVSRWVADGVAGIIAHRPGGVPAADDDETRRSLDRLAGCELGTTRITLAGGLGPGDLRYFRDYRFDVVAIGGAVVAAQDPAAAAAELRRELDLSLVQL